MDLSEQALANAYENNWTWDQTGWVADPQDSELQDFNNRWWGHPGPINNPLNIEALSMYFPRPSSILVRDCYVTMFNFVWSDAFAWKGHQWHPHHWSVWGWCVLSPFTRPQMMSSHKSPGKTLFQFYLLASLRRKHVVLFCVLPDFLSFHDVSAVTGNNPDNPSHACRLRLFRNSE